MPSITDDLMGKTLEGGKKTAETTLKTLKEAKSGIKEAEGVVKGICLLLLDGAGFTADAVMHAVRNAAFSKTGDIRFSNNNIDIGKLKKSGHVHQIEENVLQDAMKYFDQYCRKFKIKYSAMIDTRGEGKPDYAPSYMVFFEGKDSELILSALQEAYKDYANDQQRIKDMDRSGQHKDRQESQDSSERNQEKRESNREEPEKRESVKAKLAFFRDRVADRDQERDAVEKYHQHTDIQR